MFGGGGEEVNEISFYNVLGREGCCYIEVMYATCYLV
jgi:hypothetical protein